MRSFSLLILSLALLPHLGRTQDSNFPQAIFAGRQFTAEQASSAEAAIAANPDDVQDRVSLLGYYWMQAKTAGGIEAVRAPRLKHILWMIQNHPAAAIFVFPDLVVAASGNPLADPAAYEQARQAWLQALSTHANEAFVLENAAWAFRISDKEQSIELLRRAFAGQPPIRALGYRLGEEYALVLLGATGADLSGRPNQFHPSQAGSPLAQTVRAELQQSTQASLLYSTGQAINNYRDHLSKSAVPADDLIALAADLITRAKALDPAIMPQRIRVGGNVQAANLVRKVSPVYPPEALQARIQGVVRFTALIGKDGTIVNLQLVSGHPLLVQAAQDAVMQWVYKPTRLNGDPVEVITQIDVNFTLSFLPPSNRI